MDLQSQFKDLPLDESLDKEVEEIQKKVKEEHLDDDQILKDLEKRLAEIKTNTEPEEDNLAEPVVVEEYEDLEEKTFLEKIQPFILPICLTLFAIIFAALFLYFFSQSRIEQSTQAIINAGVPEPVYYPPAPVPVVIKEEPLVCEEPQYLNEDGTECLDPEPEPEPEPPAVVGFEDGTTTVAHVRFSFDKYSYDNSPRGIYMLEDQIFEGDFAGFKINPVNRAFANDYFFGIDRYTVSLIGTCSYVVDDAKILVQNMRKGNNSFSGNVTKVIEASRPRVDCSK